MGTWGGGLNRFDPRTQQFTRYQHDPEKPISLSNDTVTSILQDTAGTIWIGTFGGGLSSYRDGRFQTFTSRDGLLSDNIASIVNAAVIRYEADHNGACPGGMADLNVHEAALDAMGTDPNMHIILHNLGGNTKFDAASASGKVILNAIQKYPDKVWIRSSKVAGTFRDKPLGMPDFVEPRADFEGVPFLQGTTNILKAVKHLIEYAEYQDRRANAKPAQAADPARRAKAQALVRVAGGRALTESEGKQVLASPMPGKVVKLLARVGDELCGAGGIEPGGGVAELDQCGGDAGVEQRAERASVACAGGDAVLPAAQSEPHYRRASIGSMHLAAVRAKLILVHREDNRSRGLYSEALSNVSAVIRCVGVRARPAGAVRSPGEGPFRASFSR